ncbi:putative MFS family arabinose efflux permease [Streptacidiphilus sp. MAP12-16]|uniref:MFS transporter n=1 Tax=Streptacidiphilus sp. MAP12-16 TaxID=3156300 RepID=UPI00351181B0
MPRPFGGSASYRAVLALPHAPGLFAAAMLARLSYGVLSLPLLLSLRQATGSYAVAGTATGLFGLAVALLAPLRGRLVDRRPGSLMLLASGYAMLLALIAGTGVVGAAPWVAVILAIAAGTVPPPVGPLMRTLWGVLAADEAQRQAALSLDTAAESTVFALGPVLGGALIVMGSPPVALAACAALVLLGFAAFAAALRRSSVRLPGGAAEAASEQQSRWNPLRVRGFAALLVVACCTGCTLAVEELAAIAAWGAGATGALMALVSVGGVLGGLLYGKRQWRAAPGRRLAALAAAGTACFALPALVPAVPAAALALLLGGACIDTQLITSYLLVDGLVPAGSRTEAGSWLNSAFNLGVAAGAGCAGVLVDRAGAGAGFLAAALVAGGAAVAAVLVAYDLGRAPAPGGPAPAARGPVHPAVTDGTSGRDHGDLADAEILERSGNC